MRELGKKNEIFNADKFQTLRKLYGRPISMPHLPSSDHKVICGYDQGMGERMFVCESLGDMQDLYDSYVQGSAMKIYWYITECPGFITPISL